MQGNPTRIKSSRGHARRLVKIAHPQGQKSAHAPPPLREGGIISSRRPRPYGAESRYGNEVDAFFSD
jgi:hypothetical protein